MVALVNEANASTLPPLGEHFLEGKRRLTESEIEILKKTNRNIDSTWQNVWVDKDFFNADLIQNCEILGFLVIGKLRKINLKYHDLLLAAGLYNSYLENLILGDDNVVRNVSYFSNYRTSSRVILFNIQEISCTVHSKFGNGIVKDGEPESNRIWIGVGNENDNRAILAFEDMIPADAYLWSRYREDTELLECFKTLVEACNNKKCDTMGFIGSDSVIKNTTLLKDAKIGECAYIKGAFKLKNITILSSADEPSQIGEGVELVNGIVGFGSRIFYQAVAVRFVIGRNCQLKYGARLLNSVLGDNSTVSCCEILNNLIFPFHEQHHNSSFLIAATVCGQSNVASGATIGSNHNSRSPDGEMFAGRGFWPGLCSDFKHNSKFASFTLVSKGSYQNELNITYPFSLVASNGPDKPISIIPAYWFLYNMYAIARNNAKFQSRDKRVIKRQHIETNPLAPDSIQEVVQAVERIIELTARYLLERKDERVLFAKNDEERLQFAKDFLHQNPKADFKLQDLQCQKKFGAVILKPVKAYKEYRKILKYFAASTLLDYCAIRHIPSLNRREIIRISQLPLYTRWLNVGGQVIPEEKIKELFVLIKNHSLNSWAEVHGFYDNCDDYYMTYKVAYATYILEFLYSKPICEFLEEDFDDIINDVTAVSDEMYDAAIGSRKKDYDDYFRKITFRNEEEFQAVLGTIDSNQFLNDMKPRTAEFDKRLGKLFVDLC
ncbi:DUF4954 family protein [Treponema zioleckii]|uniref:DUF4954 family protein n=1 Tax=Treponema zioleckii TaxID=331680 RepID=UPI00168AC590|nr:DUF4954 family protein [Treponema zioleckii]